MIRVTIDLISAIHESRDKRLGVMYISNDGTCDDPERGHYDVKVCRKGHIDPDGPLTRTGRVESYQRLAFNVWRLIARALLSAFPEERSARAGKAEQRPDV